MGQKLVKRIFIWIAGSAGILLVLLFTLGYVYNEEVKQYILKEANKQLKTEIKVSNIQLDLLTHFPSGSLRFENLLAMEAWDNNHADTLIYASDLYLKFGLFDLFTNNFDIQKLEIHDARVLLKRNSNKEINYSFWESDTTSSGKSAVSFDLREVKFRNTYFVYDDQWTDFELKSHFNTLTCEGKFAESTFHANLWLDSRMEIIRNGKDIYIKNRKLEGKINGWLANGGEEIHFEPSSVNLDKVGLNVRGKYLNQPEGYALDLSGKSTGEIKDLISLFPLDYQKKLNDYNLKGSVDLDFTLTRNPQLKKLVFATAYKIKHGRFEEKDSGVELTALDSEGTYTTGTGEWDALEIQNLKAKLGPGEIKLTGKAQNLKEMQFQVNIDAEVNLDKAREFFKWKNFETLEGNVYANCSISGNLNQKKDGSFGFRHQKAQGKLDFDHIQFQLKDQNQPFSIASGQILLNDKDAAVQDFVFMVGSSDFELNGFARNLLSYLMSPGEKLLIDAEITSNKIDLNQLLSNQKNVTTPDTSYQLVLSPDISVKMRAEVKDLEFRRFRARNMQFNATLSEGIATINPLSFKMAEGDFTADIKLSQPKGEGIFISCNANLDNLDIAQVFYSFEDFGQDFLKSHHLGGRVTADGVFKASMTKGLSINSSTVYSLIDISIEEGRLKNLSALQQVSNYIKQNKLLAPLVKIPELEKNLADLSFSNLQNQIKIENKTVYMPSMAVKTNAMNINASGKHHFDNNIDYRINFKLSNLLTNKTNANSEFGEITDDGTGTTIFLSMTGPASDPDFSMDRESAREHRKESLAEEKKNLKSIFREELGLFKKDTTLTNPKPLPEKPKPNFEVEWEEFKDTLQVSAPGKKTFWEKLKEKNDSKKDDQIYDDLDDDF